MSPASVTRSLLQAAKHFTAEMSHSGRPLRGYAFPLSPEKSLIIWTALIQNGQLFIRGGWSVPSARFCSHTFLSVWKCLSQSANSLLGYQIFFRVSGGCFGVGRRPTGQSMESLRIHLAAIFCVVTQRYFERGALRYKT